MDFVGGWGGGPLRVLNSSTLARLLRFTSRCRRWASAGLITSHSAF